MSGGFVPRGDITLLCVSLPPRHPLEQGSRHWRYRNRQFPPFPRSRTATSASQSQLPIPHARARLSAKGGFGRTTPGGGSAGIALRFCACRVQSGDCQSGSRGGGDAGKPAVHRSSGAQSGWVGAAPARRRRLQRHRPCRRATSYQAFVFPGVVSGAPAAPAARPAAAYPGPSRSLRNETTRSRAAYVGCPGESTKSIVSTECPSPGNWCSSNRSPNVCRSVANRSWRQMRSP